MTNEEKLTNEEKVKAYAQQGLSELREFEKLLLETFNRKKSSNDTRTKIEGTLEYDGLNRVSLGALAADVGVILKAISDGDDPYQVDKDGTPARELAIAVLRSTDPKKIMLAMEGLRNVTPDAEARVKGVLLAAFPKQQPLQQDVHESSLKPAAACTATPHVQNHSPPASSHLAGQSAPIKVPQGGSSLPRRPAYRGPAP